MVQVRRRQREANGKGWRSLPSAYILVILAVVQAHMEESDGDESVP